MAVKFDKSIYNRLSLKYRNSNDSKYLYEIREYLDSCGFRMPIPKYSYKEDDIRTWKYMNSKCSYNPNTKCWHVKERFNPLFTGKAKEISL